MDIDLNEMFFRTREGFTDERREIVLSSEEYRYLMNTIDQLKKPWIRNANKDRNIRPARSHCGYRLLSVKETKNFQYSTVIDYQLEFETPYAMGAFDFNAAKIMIQQDAEKIGDAFGYEAVYFLGKPSVKRGRTLYEVKIIADWRYKFYRIAAKSAALPVWPDETDGDS